jgi:anti-sigma factor RsiW
MTHPDLEARIDAYLDGELAASEAVELEAHLVTCAACRRFREDRLALRASIAAQIPRFEAPEGLREAVRAGLHGSSGLRGARRRSTPSALRWLGLAASLAVVALGSWRLAVRHATGEGLAEDVLTAHVRSLMPGHLTDVLSSDQHTVKPWFNGKLDFSPPVYDFSGRGYPLLGGRLDYLDRRSVAALVYGRRQHLINVFLWPGQGAKGGTAPLARQGYHMLQWATPEYTYWVVSDLGLTELSDFVRLVQLGDSAAAATPR